MDSDFALKLFAYVVPSVSSIVMGIFAWSISRNVRREDEDNKRRDSMLDSHTKELTNVRQAMSDIAHKNELSARDVSMQVSSISASVGELKGAVTGLRVSFEDGREKQAAFYRTELAKLEQSLRQEMARHIQPDIPERVGALEALLESKSKRRK